MRLHAKRFQKIQVQLGPALVRPGGAQEIDGQLHLSFQRLEHAGQVATSLVVGNGELRHDLQGDLGIGLPPERDTMVPDGLPQHGADGPVERLARGRPDP